MIPLTRLDGREVVVNADHLLLLEATPDTMLVLTTGQHLLVKERVPEVVERVATWRRRVARGADAVASIVPLHRSVD